MKKPRPIHFFLGFVLAIGLVGYAVWPQEPVYGGQELSQWLDELVVLSHGRPDLEDSEARRAAWHARHERAVTVAREQQDPNGLNGFILMFHLGSGPGRTDKFHPRLGELLGHLTAKGYRFVTVDEMFDPPAAQERRQRLVLNPGSPFSSRQAMEAFRRRYGYTPLPPEPGN